MLTKQILKELAYISPVQQGNANRAWFM